MLRSIGKRSTRIRGPIEAFEQPAGSSNAKEIVTAGNTPFLIDGQGTP